MTDRQLIEAAMQVRLNAYAPYSDFAVGAALLTAHGTVYTGCNVESACFPAGVCAERNALYAAVAAGERDFVTLAVVGWKRDEDAKACMPCGICRQALFEFNTGLRIVTGTPGSVKEYILHDIFPYGFGRYSLD